MQIEIKQITPTWFRADIPGIGSLFGYSRQQVKEKIDAKARGITLANAAVGHLPLLEQQRRVAL